MYKILRRILFCFDPERVHYFSMNSLRFLCRLPGGKALIASIFYPKGDNQYSEFTIQFPNRVGLGAGFDKNARYLNELEALGFGCVEIGTITPLPQPGNDKPRLFRLPKDKALINRMGFNNDGVDEVVKRLKAWREKTRNPKPAGRPAGSGTRNLVIGGNIGKNKVTPNEEAWKDYEKCFLALYPYVDYFVVNVSSPNTPGLRELQEKDALRKILGHLKMKNEELKINKPILLKIAPDLTEEQLNDVTDLTLEIKLDGLVASNTTIRRDKLQTPGSTLEGIGTGGLSGLPVKKRSTEIVRYIHQKTNGQLPIIASGGIFTGADAMEKINAGASLVQVWTGFIYEGPSIVKNICRQITKYQ